MPMDGVTFCWIARELQNTLVGGRVDKITQPERDEVIITIRNGGENHALLLSASPACARAQITRGKKANPLEPPNLCMLMRKHLIGGRVAQIRQAESDRILEVVIEHSDGYTTTYASLQEEVPVAVGAAVESGDIIGYVGSTATAENSMGPHLHFSVAKNGEVIDPAKYVH